MPILEWELEGRGAWGVSGFSFLVSGQRLLELGLPRGFITVGMKLSVLMPAPTSPSWLSCAGWVDALLLGRRMVKQRAVRYSLQSRINPETPFLLALDVAPVDLHGCCSREPVQVTRNDVGRQ